MTRLNRRSVLCAAGALSAAAVLPSGCAGTRSPPACEKAESSPRAKKRILILGGTGFLGPAIVEAASRRGHTLTLFNRGKTRAELFPEVEKLRGNRDGDLEALKGRTWDAVIDTSGYVPRQVTASASLLAPNVGHYVFISSISVYEDVSKPGIDETTRVAALTEPGSEDVPKHYGALKALCEEAAEKAMPGRVTNVRPGLIVGPGDPTDRFTYWPVRVSEGGEVLAPGDGKDAIQFIDVRDLGEWLVHTVEGNTTGVFNAVGPTDTLTMSTLLDRSKAVSGSDARFTWVPAAFLAEQKVSPWTDMPVWVPSEGETGGLTRVRAQRAIEKGLTFRPVDDTVRATLEWWKGLPEERRARKRAGVTRDREREVLAAWKAKNAK